MKKAILSLTFATAMLFTACKKEGETIINNYTTTGGSNEAPKRKMMTEYGDKDGNFVLKFSYYNNEIGKLQELTTYSSGVAGAKMVVLYNSNGLPTGYQTYTLPANTLDAQGTFVLDNKNRVIKVVNRKPNADTTSIINASYTSLDYQPASMNYYSKTDDKITNYSYYNYNEKGNLYSQIDYEFDGLQLYKSAEITYSGFSEAINPLNQLYYYLIVNGPSSESGQYFSNYFASSTRSQYYKPDGTSDGANINDYILETDDQNNLTKLIIGNQEVIIKY